MLLFGALAAGYALGKVKFGNFSLGSTTSVLLVAIVLGAMVLGKTQYDLGLIKTVSFGLFIFAIGYKVGPDFIGGLKRGGIKYVVISIFFCVAALIAAIVLSKLFGLNKGYSGGLVAGALTQSSVIGTASGAIQKLGGGSVTSVIDLKSDIAVAYAVTYIFGTAGLIILLKVLVACWKMDLPAYARKAEEELGSLTAPETVEAFHWAKLVVPRAYRVEKKDIAGKTVSEVEAMFSCRVSVSRVKKGDNIITDLSGGTTLDEGDVLVVTGLSSLILKAGDIIGPECDDNVLKQLVGEILGVCLTSKKYDGKTLNEIFSSVGHGCFLRSVTRQGHELPVAPGLKIHRGDIVNVIGVREDIERFAGEIGYAERPTTVTDLVMVSLGIILGTLVGLCSINLGGVPLTLGVGGGVLVAGLFVG
jgi:putative transport protein